MQSQIEQATHSLPLCCTLSSTGVILAVSPSSAASLGCTVESLLQTSVFLLFHADDRSKVQTAFHALLQHAVETSVSVRLLEADDSSVQVTATVQVLQGLETIFLLSCSLEQDLRQSEQRYRRFVENSNEGIWEIDAESITTFVNSRMAAMLGYTVEEMLGVSLFAFMDEEWRSVATTNVKRRQQGVTEQHDFKFLRQDGSEIWVIISTSPIRDEMGQYIGAVATVMDITERKRAEAALKASEAKLNAILDNAIAAICSFRVFANSDWEYDYYSSGAQSVYGYSSDDFLSNKYLWRSRVLPEDWDAIATNYFENVFAERVTTWEYRFRRKDGTLCWISETSISRRDEANNCWVVTAVGINITNLKQAEAELRQSEKRFRAIFENAAIGIASADMEGRQLGSNPAWQSMIGYSADEIRQMKFHDYTHPDDLNIDLDQYARLIAGEQDFYQIEKRYIRKNGQEFYGRLTVAIVREAEGQPQFAFGMIEDITQRKQIEAELRKNEARTRAILAAIPDIIDLINADGIYLEAIRSNTVKDLVPLDIDPAGRNLLDFIPADLAARELQAVQRAIATGELQILENQVWIDEQLQYEEMRVAPYDANAAVVMIRDISDRKKAELELQSVNNRLQYLLTATPVVIFTCKPDGDYGATFMSENTTTVLGYEPQQFIDDASFWISKIHPADRQRVLSETNKIFERNIHAHEFRFLHANGHYCWLYEQLKLVRDEAGKPVEIVGYIIDISARKQAEISLRQSEALFRSIFENAAIGITVTFPPDHKFTQFNPAFQNMLGYTAAELATLDYLYITHPEDLVVEQQLIQKVLEEKRNSYTLEKRYLCKDGYSIWVNIIASIIWSDDGQVQMAIVMIENINDRKRSEAALRESEARFRKVFADAPMGVALVTPEGYITQANSAFCRMLDYSELELKAQHVRNLIHAEDVEAHLSYTRQLFNREIPQYKLEGRFLQSNGKIVWVKVSAVLFQELSSATPYKLVMFENITEQRAIEQMKDHFVSIVSHELRTPLTSIRGSLGLLATGQVGTLTAEGEEILNIATLESQRLMRLVNDILDLERLRSGHISLVPSLCQVSDLITRSINSVRSFANESGIEIEASAASQAVWVDSDRIIQTLTNLLNNAIKFSPLNSKIWVMVRAMAEAIHIPSQPPCIVPPSVLFEVKDQGIGIPSDKINIIFEPFEQVDMADSRYRGGSGLGLAICKSIVQGHGGQIWATSTPRQGSSFFFTIPFPHSSLAAAVSTSFQN